MSLASLDKQAVEQFTRDFETLFNTGDAAGMAAYYAEDGGQGRQITTKYATIWQRDADDRWRLAVDSSSPNPPAS